MTMQQDAAGKNMALLDPVVAPRIAVTRLVTGLLQGLLLYWLYSTAQDKVVARHGSLSAGAADADQLAAAHLAGVQPGPHVGQAHRPVDGGRGRRDGRAGLA